MIESSSYLNDECGEHANSAKQVLSYKLPACTKRKLLESGLSDTSLKGWLKMRRSLSEES